jgi:hypothetical protein
MNFTTKMVFLGVEAKTSKKSGKGYLMGKFMDPVTSSIFEFYISGESLALVTELGQLKQFSLVGVKLEMTSYQGNIRVDIVGVQS